MGRARRLFDDQGRALQGGPADDQFVAELHCVGHHARQRADIESHDADLATSRPLGDHVDHALGDGKLVHLCSLPLLYDDGYFALVEAAPWLVGWGYDANDPPFKLAKWIAMWDRINTTSTARAIKAFRPTIAVCTHFLPTRMVSLMLTRGVLEAKLAVVTTDYDFQGLWLTSPFNHFFVAREETKAYMAAIGVPTDRITVSGIPVRLGLAEAVDREAVLRRYELRPDWPILLISA